jgi:hypothetical protein
MPSNDVAIGVGGAGFGVSATAVLEAAADRELAGAPAPEEPVAPQAATTLATTIKAKRDTAGRIWNLHGNGRAVVSGGAWLTIRPDAAGARQPVGSRAANRIPCFTAGLATGRCC